MTAKQRKLRREQLDRTLGDGAISSPPMVPQGGWVQAIREALGMTLEALGARLGISRQSAHQLEHAEATDSITVKRLRAAAEVLDCELVVYFRPKQPLDQIIRNQANAVARQLVMRAGNSMAMEDQAVSNDRLEKMIEDMALELIDKNDPRLWQ